MLATSNMTYKKGRKMYTYITRYFQVSMNRHNMYGITHAWSKPEGLVDHTIIININISAHAKLSSINREESMAGFTKIN